MYLLFSDDTRLTEFIAHVEAYQHDRRKPGAKGPPNAWLAWIKPGGVAHYGPEDRTGPLLARLQTAGGPQPEVLYWLDLELWDLGDVDRNRQSLVEVEAYVRSTLDGEVTDSLVRPGLVSSLLMRNDLKTSAPMSYHRYLTGSAAA